MVLEMRLLHRENSGDVQSTPRTCAPQSMQQSTDQQMHVRKLLKFGEKPTKKGFMETIPVACPRQGILPVPTNHNS